ncbi:MAG: hypothetical protein KDJ35_08675 [Alphaproteobacteria bacterium]|nr:hypothetical protein [Alphaproteobacteria bacterium]
MGMHCPITGINIPRFLISAIAGFLFLFGFDYLVHHIWLNDAYVAHIDLWRPAETMEGFYPYMIARQVLLVVLIGYIFTLNFEEKGLMEGVRFGIPVGLLLGLVMASSYIWMPITQELALGWLAGGLGSGLGLGIIFALLYKK